MGSQARAETASTPPKISYYSLPTKRPDPPGMATPPLRLPGSVPFLWEEAPGKPRRQPNPSVGSVATKCLDLPPRMVVAAAHEEVKDTKVPSPTTVLNGPYILSRPPSMITTCYSFSAGDDKLFKISKKVEKKHGEKRVWFWRRVKGRKVGKWVVNKGRVECGSPALSSSFSSVSSSSRSWGEEGGDGKQEQEAEEEEEEIKVNIMRIRRNRSLSNFSYYAKSHLWASIKGRLKRVVPWRRD